jgi:RNA polymerase sigma-70 factor (ECF subfamily)
MDDSQILQEIRKGNTSLFKELIKRYESLVAATVIGMLGKCSEVDDVGQEVFIRFYKAIDKFRGESAVGTYLTRIAINLSINELRRRQKRNHFYSSSNEELHDIADPGNRTGAQEDKEIVQKAIETLTPKFRSVIVLRLIDGYSTEETAKILKLPLGTVLSRLARAQQKLKQLLSPIMEVNDG